MFLRALCRSRVVRKSFVLSRGRLNQNYCVITSLKSLQIHKGLKFRLYSSETNGEIDSIVFEKACNETLTYLCDFFENLIEDNDSLRGSDVVYSDGVLTVNLGSHGIYVINRQSPNKQIWLSSPQSGPKRYDFIEKTGEWQYKHENVTLHHLLETEISNILGNQIKLS